MLKNMLAKSVLLRSTVSVPNEGSQTDCEGGRYQGNVDVADQSHPVNVVHRRLVEYGIWYERLCTMSLGVVCSLVESGLNYQQVAMFGL